MRWGVHLTGQSNLVFKDLRQHDSKHKVGTRGVDKRYGGNTCNWTQEQIEVSLTIPSKVAFGSTRGFAPVSNVPWVPRSGPTVK